MSIHRLQASPKLHSSPSIFDGLEKYETPPALRLPLLLKFRRTVHYKQGRLRESQVSSWLDMRRSDRLVPMRMYPWKNRYISIHKRYTMRLVILSGDQVPSANTTIRVAPCHASTAGVSAIRRPATPPVLANMDTR